MKHACLSIIFLAALAQITNAQDVTNSITESSLQIDTRTDEQRIEFLLNVAQVYFDEENYEDAIDAYERVLEIDPDHKQARYTVSHVYINANEYEKAIVELNGLLENNPEDYHLMNNLAWLYATAEDPKYRDGTKAIQLAQNAMVLAPNDHHIWSTLSEAYYITGEYEKAYRAITHMAKLAARYGKGLSKEAVDNYNEQIRKCKRAWDTKKMLEGEEVE